MSKASCNRAKSTLIKRVNSINTYLDFGVVPSSTTIIELCAIYAPNEFKNCLENVKSKMSNIIKDMN